MLPYLYQHFLGIKDLLRTSWKKAFKACLYSDVTEIEWQLKVNIINENFTDCCWQWLKVFAFSVSFLERVKPMGSVSVPSCDYLTLRAEFTMPPRKKTLSTLTNLRVEQKQSASESDNFQRVLRKNSWSLVRLPVCCVMVSTWHSVVVFFRCIVLAWRGFGT